MKVIAISASGIGNTILATPMLIALCGKVSGVEIDLLTSRTVFQACLRKSGIIREYFSLEDAPLATLLQLRKEKYDYAINCFPSNRWQYNLTAYLTGAGTCISHVYPEGNRLGFLINKQIPADPKVHDSQQNMNLLSGLGIPVEKVPHPIFSLSEEDEENAINLLKKLGIFGSNLFGCHIGGGTLGKGLKQALFNKPLGQGKCWSLENYRAEIIKSLDSDFDHCLLFGSGDEIVGMKALRENLCPDYREKTHVIEASIYTTAALIKQCAFFLSGDTGLMHIAACYKIPQKAIFIATNPIRTAPVNPNAELVVGEGCENYQYPFYTDKASITPR